MKTVGGFRRTRYRGLDRAGLGGYLVGTAYNLVRKARLMAAETPAPQAAQGRWEAAPYVIGPEAGALHRPSHHPTTRCSATVRSRQQPSHRHETPFFRSLLGEAARPPRPPLGAHRLGAVLFHQQCERSRPFVHQREPLCTRGGFVHQSHSRVDRRRIAWLS